MLGSLERLRPVVVISFSRTDRLRGTLIQQEAGNDLDGLVESKCEVKRGGSGLGQCLCRDLGRGNSPATCGCLESAALGNHGLNDSTREDRRETQAPGEAQL